MRRLPPIAAVLLLLFAACRGEGAGAAADLGGRRTLWYGPAGHRRAGGGQKQLRPRPGAAALRFPRRPRTAPGFRNRVVVFHRPPAKPGRPPLRLPADLLPPRPGRRGNAARIGLGHPAALFRPLHDHRRRRDNDSIPSKGFPRGALGLAEATAAPFRVAIEDWQAASTRRGRFSRSSCKRRTTSVALELDARMTPRAGSPRATAGSPARVKGRATRSYYYSYPRLARPRQNRARRAKIRGPRRGLARPRMEHQRALRARPGRLGLVFAPARRRPQSDALPAAPEGRQPRPLLRRHPDRKRRQQPPDSPPRTSSSSPAPPGKARAAYARYPVAWRLSLPRPRARMRDQGPARRPGARRLLPLLGRRGRRRLPAKTAQPLPGRGYVEMVGYAEP